jgi:hypothetical protein
MIHDTPPYGHAPIPNIIDLSQKKQLFDLKVKGQGPTKVIMVGDTLLVVMHPHTKYHSPISKDKKCYVPQKKKNTI